MRRFETWSLPDVNDKPWLLVGKGPSADKLAQGLPVHGLHIFTLNDAISLVERARIAHLIDVEVWDRCGYDIEARADYLLVPDRLHVACKASALPVGVFVTGRCRWYDAQGCVVTYKKWPQTIDVPGRPPRAVACRYFSAEAALSILGELGVKRVYTIGIDGGTGYAQAFSHLQPLENGRPSFDVQEQAHRAIALHYGMEVKKWIS